MRKAYPWLILVLLLIALGLGVLQLQGRQPEIRFPVETNEVGVPHDTTTVPDATLANGQQLVSVTGKDGLLRTFTYYEERWLGGTLQQRTKIPPAGRPTSEWITTPTVEVVLVGTKGAKVFDVVASNERGVLVGRIGASGVFSFRITGSVTFAGPVTVCGPLGNTHYAYAHRPMRPDVAPGAALIRVGAGRWMSLTEIGGSGGVYTVHGARGATVLAIVNDAPHYFGDNRGAFALSAAPAR